MGIQGLIPSLKSIQKPVHIEKYAGQTVAVDAQNWLYRGTISCASELARDIETDAYVQFFMMFVKMLLFYKVVPIIVFNGQNLPMKQATAEARASDRLARIDEGNKFLKEGKVHEANNCFQKTVTITPVMIENVIKELEINKVRHIVSPYDANSQLAYLLKTNQAKTIISENSSLLAFGCSNIIYKMKKTGDGVQIYAKDIFTRLTGVTDANKLRSMCILSGCEYLPSLKGIGLKKAQYIVAGRKTVSSMLETIQNRLKINVPKEYQENFMIANAAYLYQFVFDPSSKTYVRFNPLPKNIKINYLSGLGESPQNQEVSLLKSNNAIYLDYARISKEANKENIDPFVHLEPSEFDEFKLDQKELEELDNILKKTKKDTELSKKVESSIKAESSIKTKPSTNGESSKDLSRSLPSEPSSSPPPRISFNNTKSFFTRSLSSSSSSSSSFSVFKTKINVDNLSSPCRPVAQKRKSFWSDDNLRQAKYNK